MNRALFITAMAVLGFVSLAGTAAGQPPQGLHRVERGEPLDPCPPLQKGYVIRESHGKGFIVDSCGRKVDSFGSLLPLVSPPQAEIGAGVTIDGMKTSHFGSHAAGGPLTLVGSADTYRLSDGSEWQSGAGSYYLHSAQLDHVEVSGTTIRYVLNPPASGFLYQQTDYDAGNHSAQGTLGPSGPLVLEAQAGSTAAVLKGNALLVSNEATYYGEPRFNYYTAIVGSVLPIQVVYTIQGDTWTADTFSRSFSYSTTGSVDFAHPVSSPRAVALSIMGPSRIPDDFTTRFTATVLYENGVQRNAGARASWTVDPPELASVAGGVLTVEPLQTQSAYLTLRAMFFQDPDSLAAEKPVLVLADSTAEEPGTWPMFQANARHTGYIAAGIEPTAFQLKWQREMGSGMPLNPVAAGDGKVFVTRVTYFDDVTTLFALSAADGATLWSKGFGDVFSVNPPSYAYGNVYVQTGNHATDTWLHAFDGATGDTVFKAPHAAQWERYFAPTIYDGKAYVNGGTYGGMYAFDAFTGDELWYASLPQYDQWTPAVDAGHAYAYLGEYTPGLYVQDRASGASAFFVSDPNFSWNGWSMNVAPVLGDQNDVIAIHDGRLLSFDTESHTIRWEVQSQFTGQPSVAQGRIYAIDDGRLRVLDELTHAELWSWQPPADNLTGAMIVTAGHIFVSTSASVHAVDLAAHQSAWSYPVGGHLAIADNTLYVASSNGRLTAFAQPPSTSFYTLPPCRMVDTRDASGGPALPGGIVRSLHLAELCGVPATAKAIAVNVTVTQAGSAGYLRLGSSDPAAVYSTISYVPGTIRANNAIITLDASGNVDALAVQNPGTTVHLILDVSGYFE
ncbi:MAG: PQQ-binding-like beta-propeller repeat protein [Thermoanaerobaculia bacterium]